MTATLKHASCVPGTYTKGRPDYVLTAEKYMQVWEKNAWKPPLKRRHLQTFHRPSASHEKSGPVPWKSPTR